MDSVLFTESANRALKKMEVIACCYQTAEIEPLHLFLALFVEESRASELLINSGMTEKKIESEFSVSFSEFLADNAEKDSKTEEQPRSETIRKVVNEAILLANEAGRYGEVGSEHLLWGLSRVNSSVEKFLSENYIKLDELRESVFEVTGVSLTPLSSDEQLQFPEVTESDQTGFLRILDASANRSREGLRVLEDYVRFIMDDRYLSTLLKECRHSLAEIFNRYSSLQVTSSRATETDVGTSITTASEKRRESAIDLIRANFKRVQEALRSLEEYSKAIEPESSEHFEKIRYRIYTIEKAVENTFISTGRLKDALLYLLVSEELCDHGSGPVIREALAAGTDIIQIREKDLNDRQLIEHGLRVRKWTKEAGGLFIMNDRADLASIVGADGVHLGQDDMSVYQARKIMGVKSIIGVSTHNIDQARQAVLDGADYIGVGPTFPSQTKEFDQFSGLDYVKQVADEIQIPWYAIGGIQLENVESVLKAGANRIAVSGVICRSVDPAKQASTLKTCLKSIQ